jgi:Trp operon repressor
MQNGDCWGWELLNRFYPQRYRKEKMEVGVCKLNIKNGSNVLVTTGSNIRTCQNTMQLPQHL